MQFIRLTLNEAETLNESIVDIQHKTEMTSKKLHLAASSPGYLFFPAPEAERPWERGW